MINYNVLNNEEVYKFIDFIPLSICWKDSDGRYLGCNQEGLNVFGLSTRDQVIGKTDYEILPVEIANKVIATDKIASANGYYSNEDYIIVKDVVKTFLTTKTKLCNENGDFIGVLSTSVDVSVIKDKMELDKKAALLEEDIKMRQILDLVPAHIYWKHKNEYYLGCNKHQEEFIGGSLKNNTEYDYFPKDEADKIHRNDQYVLEHGAFSGEEIGTGVDGITKTFFSSKRQLLNVSGEVVGLVGVTVDISDIKEKERLLFEIQSNQIEQQAQFRKIAAQVAHDIASPVFALQMILPHCNALPENMRSALSKFSIRIIDIAQNFLSQFKQKPEDGVTINGVTRINSLIYSELIEIITEKKYEYSHKLIKFITEINSNSYFIFVNIDTSAFKRMISNIINNAVDALEDVSGIVKIYLDTVNDKVQVIIEDNGKGISKEVMDKILDNISVTSGKVDGHGIGFSQIRDTLTNNDGSFSINSELGHGTKITLTFPKADTPKWITDKIELNHDDLVVIVDDEPYVHEAWECQFKSIVPNISRQHFEQGEEAISFLNQLTEEEKSKVFLLTDYELLKQKLNGLDIIEKSKIGKAILVTSHHNDHEIREKASNFKIKILPKELAFAVTINLVE